MEQIAYNPEADKKVVGRDVEGVQRGVEVAGAA
jgi:hypothetical protein